MPAPEKFVGGYAGWRASLPWTDEQLATACDEEADAIAATSAFLETRYRRLAELARRGQVFSQTVRIAVPRLVKTCALCGKKALYMTGNEGRCSVHRRELAVAVVARSARIERRGADIRAYERAKVAAEQSHRNAARTNKWGTGSTRSRR